MVARDGAYHGIAAATDRFDCVLRRAVLQDDLQLGEFLVDALERRQEASLRVEDSDPLFLAMVTSVNISLFRLLKTIRGSLLRGTLAMQVQNL